MSSSQPRKKSEKKQDKESAKGHSALSAWLFEPSSLLTRTNFTLAISSLLIALIALAALNQFVIEPIIERSADDEAGLLVLSAQTWVELSPDARPYFELELAQNHDLIISGESRELPAVEPLETYDALLQEKLGERLGEPVGFQQADELIWANISMGGHDLQVGFSPDRRNIQPLSVGFIIVGLGAAIVFATSLFIVTRITGPLVRAAESAEAFRGAEDFQPLPESGPRELVSLARNFNTMAREISTLMSNRTTMLAGISHDLRTPLTRMRLALELLPANTDVELVARLERNLARMDELIADALSFARGTAELPVKLDLHSFVREIANNFEPPIPVRFAAQPEQLNVASGALARVLANLIDNGRQHAQGVNLFVGPQTIEVIDTGDGIPVAEREQVFQPFYRLDSARGVGTGGSGLGLAIVKQLCDAHGWRISLETGPDGRGNRAIIRL